MLTAFKMVSINLIDVMAKVPSDWQHLGEGSWTLAMKQREDEEWETAMGKSARVHFTLA